MNFLQRARFFFGQSLNDYIQLFLRGDDIPDLDYPGQVDSQTAMKYTAVFACVRVLAETLAGTPVMLYRKNDNGDREIRNDLSVYDILHNQPNEEMEKGNKPAAGKSKWTVCSVKGIITNEKYVGDFLIGKHYTTEDGSFKRKRNYGQAPMYYVRDHHPPIVSRELFEQAQAVLAQRRKQYGIDMNNTDKYNKD